MEKKVRAIRNILDYCWNLRTDASTTNVRIDCSDGPVFGHRLVVACASDHIREVLLTDWQSDISVITLAGASRDQVEFSLKSLYCDLDGAPLAELISSRPPEKPRSGSETENDLVHPFLRGIVPCLGPFVTDEDMKPAIKMPMRNRLDYDGYAQNVEPNHRYGTRNNQNADILNPLDDNALENLMKINPYDDEEDDDYSNEFDDGWGIEENGDSYGRSTRKKKKKRKHRSDDSDSEFRCTICHMHSTSKQALITHMNRKHGVRCCYCGQTFTKNSEREDHLFQQHADVAVYSCPHCPYQVRQRYQMHYHRKHQHNDESLLLCTCRVCGEGFEHLLKLQSHLVKMHGWAGKLDRRTSHKNEPLDMFVQNSEERFEPELGDDGQPLPKKPKWNNSDDPMFKETPCPMCPHISINASALASHLYRKHNTQCRYCGMDCGTNDTLTQHLYESHSDCAVYTCPHCRYQCKPRKMMIQHRRQLHGDDTTLLSPCNHCTLMFESLPLLHEHLQKIHGWQGLIVVKKEDRFTTLPEDIRKTIFDAEANVEKEDIDFELYDDSDEEENRQMKMKKKKKVQHIEKDRKFNYSDFESHVKSVREMPDNATDLICHFCNLNSTNKHALLVHLHRKHGLRCSYCGITFDTSEDRDKHLYQDHADVATYTCAFCPYQARARKMMLDHRASRHNDYSQMLCKCRECGSEFEHLLKLQDHLHSEHQWEAFAMNRFKQAKNGDGSLRLVDGKLIKQKFDPNLKTCEICKVQVTTDEDMKQHVQEAHTLPCHVCGKIFRSRIYLNNHVKKYHEREPEICPVCQKPTRQLQRHIKNVHDLGKFICDTCGKEFEKLSTLQAHMRYKHGVYMTQKGPRYGGYTCKKCNEKFTELNAYKMHQIHAHPEPCPICGKEFGQLKNHMNKVHALDRDFSCDICQYRYKRAKDLHAHLKTKHGITQNH